MADWTGGTYTATSNEYLDDGTIYVESDATLTINQGVTVTVERGIIMRNNATLTITGGGKLIVTDVVSGFSAIEGNVVVMGGTTVEATGGKGDGGENGEDGDNCSDGENGGAGSDGLSAFSGNVTIYSGSITANGGQGGQGGGGGNGGNCDQPGQKGGNGGNGGDAGDGGPAFSGTLTIYGGIVIATGGDGGPQMNVYGDGGMGDPQGDHGSMGPEGAPSNAFTSNNIITFQVDPSNIYGGLDEDDYSAIGQNDITTPEKYYIQIASPANDPVVDPVTYVTRQILVGDVDGWDGDYDPLTTDVLSDLYDGHFNSITFQEACSWEAPQGDSWLIYSVSNGVFSYVTFSDGAPTSGSTTFTGKLKDLYNEMGNNNVKIYYPYELDNYTVTIGVNEAERGSVEMLVGTVWDSAIWNNNDWARVRNFSRSSNNITISVSDTASSLSNYSYTGKNNRGYFDLNLYERYSESLTFASGSDKNFEHIQLLSTKPYFEEYEAEVSGHNMTIYSNFYVTPSTGWSYTEGEKNIDWHGNLHELVLTKCTAYVDQIVFTRVGDSLRVVATAPNEYSIYENDQVNVRATANTGYHLTGWSNDFPVNASNTVRATITRDSTIIANFDTNEYTLTVAVADGQDAMGNVDGSNPAVKHFLNYQISATPNQGYIFKEWNDGNTDAVRTVTLTENTTYTASFAPDTFTVVVNTNNEQYGTVTVGGSIEPVIGENSYSGSGAPYESGSEYSYVQQIYTGSEVQYSGTINAISFYLTYSINSSATNDFTLFMKNVERETFANNSDFEPVTASDIVFEGDWTIPADYTGWVTINLDTPFEYDNTKNLLIAMDENTDGYQNLLFANHPKTSSVVSAYSSTNPDPSTIGEFSGSKLVRSNRAQIKLDMDVDGIALGGILVNDSTFRFAYNSEVSVTATPTAGNHLSAWSNGVAVANPAGATQTITLVRDTVVRAIFEPNPFVTISVNDENMGTIEIVENENATLLGDLNPNATMSIDVKVEPYQYYVPEGDTWVSTDPVYVQVLPVDNQNGPQIHHAVAYNAGGDSAVFARESEYSNSITIRLKNGKVYGGNDIMFNTPLMEGGITHIKVYSVDASMPEGLTQVSEGVYQVPEGTTVSIRATRALGHYLSAWSNGVEVADRVSDVQRIIVASDTAISATFALNPYLYVAVSPDEAGTVTIANNAGVAPFGNNTYGVIPGTKFIATATPAAAYHLTGWSTGSPNIEFRKDTVVMGSEELTLTALFDTNSYVLTVAVADGQDAMGTVDGDNDAAKHFRNYEISATGNHGYRFSQWSDGNTDNPRSVSLTKDSTFTASFVLDTFTLAIAVSPEQMGGASLLATNDVEWDEALLQTPDFSSNANNPFVSQQISLTANDAMFSSGDWATFNGAVLSAGDMSTLKFTAPAGHNFSKIEIAASNFNEFEAGNGWTRSGDFAIWSGAPVHDVLLTSGLFGVTQITFTLDTILPAGVVADGNGAYRMPYMTSGVLRAIPLRGHHFVEWKEADTTYSTDAQVAVQALGNRTLTAHFAANPVLTLTSSAHGAVAVENTVSSTIANVRYTELRGGEMLRVGDTIYVPEGTWQFGPFYLTNDGNPYIVMRGNVNNGNFSPAANGSNYVVRCMNYGNIFYTTAGNLLPATITSQGLYVSKTADLKYSLYVSEPSTTPEAIIDLDSGRYSVRPGVEVTATATPDEYCFVERWTNNHDNIVSQNLSYTFTVNSDTAFNVLFGRTMRTLHHVPAGWTITADGEPVVINNDTAIVPAGAAIVATPTDHDKPRVKSLAITHLVRDISTMSLPAVIRCTNGDTITGTIGIGRNADIQIIIPDGVSVVFRDLDITNVADHPTVTCLGSATFVKEGQNIITATAAGQPALVSGGVGTTLSTSGDGTIEFHGGEGALGFDRNGAALTRPTLTQEPSRVANMTYNGNARNLIVAGEVEHGTLYYSADGTNWSTTVPTATNAGTYSTLYYKVEPDVLYDSIGRTSLGSVVINKANPNMTLSSYSINWWYVTSKSTSVTVYGSVGAITASENHDKISTSVSGTTVNINKSYGTLGGYVTVTIRCAGNANYNAASANFTITND
ncbi:MAG: hypothetical protein IJU90_06655 [Bacteroidales bacterium]|nr:hypothetical protein [Bacteroidales bacterium]